MNAARRPVALAAAVVLVLEAVGIATLQWILSIFVDKQHMSLAGLQPRAMSAGTLVGGILFGLYLVFCAFVMLRSALRDRAPSGFARIVLISCAVVHGMIGAFAVGLVGWVAFIGMMVVLGLIVLTLTAYDAPGSEGEEQGGVAPNGAPPAAAGSA